MEREKEIKEFVKKRYGEAASKQSNSTRLSCCGAETIERAKAVGYSEEEIKSVPQDAVMGLGCGNPTALADLKEGETVVDLGSGGGFDAFLAAQRVGKTGKVIGIDMTEEMVEKARRNASRHSYKNVEFKLGEIENLPLEDNSVDVIISNCVVVLSPNKLNTYKEALRVLKPGGRMLISDLVTKEKLPEDIRRSFEAWAECIAGAQEKQEYLDTIEKAGFREVSIVAEQSFDRPEMEDCLKGKVIGIRVKAYKLN